MDIITYHIDNNGFRSFTIVDVCNTISDNSDKKKNMIIKVVNELKKQNASLDLNDNYNIWNMVDNDKYGLHFKYSLPLEFKKLFMKGKIEHIEKSFKEPEFAFINHSGNLCDYDSCITILASCTLVIKWLGELCQKPGTIPVMHCLYQLCTSAHSEMKICDNLFKIVVKELIMDRDKFPFFECIYITDIINLFYKYGLSKKIMLLLDEYEFCKMLDNKYKTTLCNNLTFNDIKDDDVKYVQKNLLDYIYENKPVCIEISKYNDNLYLCKALGYDNNDIKHLSVVIIYENNKLSIIYDNDKIDNNVKYIRYELKVFQTSINGNFAVFSRSKYNDQNYSFCIHNEQFQLASYHDIIFNNKTIKNCNKNYLCYVRTDCNCLTNDDILTSNDTIT